MSQLLSIQVSDSAYQSLESEARESGDSIVVIAARLLEQSASLARLKRARWAKIAEPERQKTAGLIRKYFGSWDSGNPGSSDNEAIDADLAREYGRDM